MKRFNELTFITPNKPGKLSQVLKTIAGKGINVIALNSSSGYDLNMVRLVVSNPRQCRAALEKLGYAVTESVVIGINVTDRPGRLAAVTTAMGKAKVNIDYIYTTASALVLFHAADVDAAERALRGIEGA